MNVSADTARRWIAALEALYFCFTVQPWHANVPKSLRKQPKVFLWDWSLVAADGPRRENLVASHLLKAVHWWTDIGLGTFDPCYVRDKVKREVDFLVTRDGSPWFLAEVKSSPGRTLSPGLGYFQHQTGATHALQVAVDADYVDVDSFSLTRPTEVARADAAGAAGVARRRSGAERTELETVATGEYALGYGHDHEG